MQRPLSNVSVSSYQEYQPSRKYGPQYEPGGYATAVQQRTNMTQREDALKFEQGRIRALQEERLHIQKKTFTKWINSFLQKARMEVDDLFQDLDDGRRLLKLLEIISGERLPRPNSGRMRVHKIENVNKSLSFLHTKVRLESIGAEDIVDGNPRLILGLVWTIILRFQIQEIEIDVDEENVSSEKKSAKDALLLWCQRKTSGYHGVHIHNFTDSWRSGLGFNALIHAHRPDLFRWADVPPEPVETLNHAFDVAHANLGIPRLLDAEDVDTSRPDEKSVMTYVASYYHTFARMKNEQKSGRRIANIIGQLMELDSRKEDYSQLASALLDWIRAKTEELRARDLPNSLDGIQRLLLAFKQYRTVEKPPKYKERSEIEALYFALNTMQKSVVGEPWTPPDGQLPMDIERAWQQLEQAEHLRELALRTELLRQQRLEQLNYKFNTKSVLRKGYLKEMIQVLSDPRYGSNLQQVDATVKKHEAISADILARTERFEDLSAMAAELVRERYHGAEAVSRTEAAVLQRWRELLELLEGHRVSLSQLSHLMSLLREADALSHTLGDIKTQFQSEEVGRHLVDVERLAQAHALQEAALGALHDSLRKLQRQARALPSQQGGPAQVSQPRQQLDSQLQHLEDTYDSLVAAAKDRRARLEDARNLYQFLEDHDEEEAWVTDKQRICVASVSAKDARGAAALKQKHAALLTEMAARDLVAKRHRDKGQSLIEAKHPKSSEISRRVQSLAAAWDALRELAAAREKQLADALEAHQFYGDANESESWMKERRALVSAPDVGRDAPAAAALLGRHKLLREELAAYKPELDALVTTAERLQQAGITQLELPLEADGGDASSEEEWVSESRLVPADVWEEQPVERLEHRTVTEERSVPQVKALYAFTGQGISMAKGEVMFLMSKTNPDWWSVRKADRTDGFVPANYVREIEPRVVPVQVRRPEKVVSVQRVKKTVLVKQVVPVRKARPVRKPRAAPAPVRNAGVGERIRDIQGDYAELQKLSEARQAQLEDAIRLYNLYAECDDLAKWMKEKDRMLRSDGPPGAVGEAKREYEKFVTDLSAANKRLDGIEAAAQALAEAKHPQAGKVSARHQQLREQWDRLIRLKQQKEKSLEGATSVELFSRTCQEAIEWMESKEQQLGAAPGVTADLRTARALQRRHARLEREMQPLRDRVHTVGALAEDVKSQYPSEKAAVEEREKELHAVWARCEEGAASRRARLESAVGLQVFGSSARQLAEWMQKVLEQLSTEEAARDAATAEAQLKQHQDLRDDIKAHQDEFVEVVGLGKQLLASQPGQKEVAATVQQLEEHHAAILKGWDVKQARLQQTASLRALQREADHLDAASRAHQAYLDYDHHPTSVDEALALVKRHEELEARVAAQQERLATYGTRAQDTAQGHYAKDEILSRRASVIQGRERVKAAVAGRRSDLQAELQYQQFVWSCEEVMDWIRSKNLVAKDQSYRDLANLERRLQRHQAFERELQANERQHRDVAALGESIVAADPSRAEAVEQRLEGLVEAWAALLAATRDKGAKLRQAADQRQHKRSVEEARLRLAELERSLRSEDTGSDLRTCKRQLAQHQTLEQELTSWETKTSALEATGEDLVSGGHFDAAAIEKESRELAKAGKELQPLAKKRRQALESSLQLHKFAAEVSGELAWVSERKARTLAMATPADLTAAQSALKKHAKLRGELQGRQPVVERVLAQGEKLVEEEHPDGEKITSLCKELEEAYSEVCSASEKRGVQLEAALKAQQFLHDAVELDSWLADKAAALAAADLGADRHRATQLLTRHKAVELELDTYAAIIAEMGRAARGMADGPAVEGVDGPALLARHQELANSLQRLQRLAAQRQKALVESVCRHEYLSESEELSQWVQEQLTAASSDDYGADYEHLLILRSKFEELRLRVEAGAERFAQCEELAHKLAANDTPHLADIERRQEALGESWQRLVEQIQSRGSRLHAAGEIHRFHRDVGELLARAADKRAALAAPPPPRDLAAASALLRNQDTIETDMVAIDAQIQVLQEEGTRLQKLYPGGNVAAIASQQQALADAWDALRDAAEARRHTLTQHLQLHRFLTQVRDLTSWSSSLRAEMSRAVRVRDAVSAQAARAEHAAARAELDARDQSFRDALALGERLVEEGHPNSEEITDRMGSLRMERLALGHAWGQRQVALDQLIDLHCFLRDAAQIHDLCAAQEAALSTEISPNSSVEEVDHQLKKHEAFEKLLATQDEKLSTLNSHGDKLLQQSHVESARIAEELKALNERRKKLHSLSMQRGQQLRRLAARAQFARAAADARGWVHDKLHVLDKQQSQAEVVNLEDKIKKLQKHQAFTAELAAHRARLAELRELAEELIPDKDVEDQIKKLAEDWQKLEQATEERGRGLEEAQDILEFNQQIDKIEAWIRDKEMMVQAHELGRDYEHCEQLQRKLDDLDSDMMVDDQRVKALAALADKLQQQGPSAQSRSVAVRRDALLGKWRSLQGALLAYRQALAAAKEIHAFNRDVSDTLERISVKSGAFAATSKGRSAEAARALQRKHAAQRAEAGAVKDRMDRLEGEGKQLANKYPERKPEIEEGLATLRERWAELQQLAERRAKQLDEAVNDHQFEETLKELEVWVGESVQRMAAAAPGRDDADADKLLDSHHEIKTEIDGRQKAIATLAAEAGEAPIRRERVQALSSALDTAWQTRKHYLTQAQQLQQLKEQARLAEDWLAAKEAVLNNDDLGEDLDAVEALLRKHAEFSKLVESQAGRITDLATFGNKLVEEQHYDSDYIRKRVTDVLARRDKLQELVVSRGSQLSQSRQLLQFLRDLAHEREWIAHRMRLASDDDYRELSNLQSKIQKHTSFEAELDASKGRLTALAAHGEALIAQNHYASREIAMHVEELENQWRDLQSLSKQRRTRLSAALAARVFLRGLDELALWLDDAEAALLSEQLGKDISSVTALLKRHSRLEQQTQAKADAVATLADTARQLADSGHFMADEIMERTYQVVKRYRGLSEPLAIRRDNLEDAMLLQRWLRDADEELRWLQERLALATSTEVAATLPEALAALNKHRALQAEILARDPMLKAVLARASTESSRGHFAAATFDARQAELANAARALRAAADARNAQLQERCEVLQLMTEISEAEAWVRTRRAILTATDVGRDEDSVLALQRRLALLQAEMAAYDQPQKLARVAAGLVEKSQEPDAEAAKRAADAVLASFEDMKLLSAKRDQRLQQSLKYFKFVQEWSEAMAWTREQLATAASEEYGTDAEHVDALQQAFAGFLQQLQANSGRIESVCEAGLALEEAGAPDAAAARAQLEDLRALWDDLRELAQARQEALAGARQVHEFDRSAEETAAWLSDKQRALDAAPRDHRDLHSAKRRLDALGADLSAITAQHEKLKEEAERLSGLFPDAREHVSAKLEEVSEALQRLAGERADRAEHLDTAAQLRDYFANYQDLLAWTSEMLARVTAGELARDVAGAERLLARHRDLEAEISAKEEDFTKLYEHGDKLISERHLMSSEISERMSVLRSRRSALGAACSARGQLYQQHLDALCFQRDADALDTWIRNRVPLVRDGELGESVSQVEELINRHRDLEETIDGQKEKFNALKRVTLVEQAFKQQQEEEANARRRSAEQQDAARLQRFRQLEMDRIVEERRKDSPMQPVLEREISVTSSAGTAPTESPEETLSPAPQFDRLPRGSVPNIALDSHVKRAESMNVTKSSKRTPSFTTRRRTQSFRRHRRADPAQLPPVEIEGDLERKQECGSGGARATVRSWRAYYSVLCGQLLCFFKDEQDFHQNKAAAPPIAILNATCTEPHDYTKRQHTFRLSCSDGARYLFAASSRAQAADWRTKLAFHAALPPSLQLTPYGEGGTPTEELKRRLKENASSSSSPASSPEPTRRPRTQAEILHEHRASQGQRQSQLENQRQSVESQKQPESQNQRQSGEIQEQKQMEGDRKSQGSAGSHSSGRVAPPTPDRNIESSVLPSLPARAPLTPTDPNANVVLRNDPNANPPRPTSPWGRSRFSNGRDVSTEFIASQRDAYGGGPRPASVAGAGSPGLDIRPASRSSGESEVSVSGTGKEKKDKKGVFGGLFSRKKRPTSHM